MYILSSTRQEQLSALQPARNPLRARVLSPSPPAERLAGYRSRPRRGEAGFGAREKRRLFRAAGTFMVIRPRPRYPPAQPQEAIRRRPLHRARLRDGPYSQTVRPQRPRGNGSARPSQDVPASSEKAASAHQCVAFDSVRYVRKSIVKTRRSADPHFALASGSAPAARTRRLGVGLQKSAPALSRTNGFLARLRLHLHQRKILPHPPRFYLVLKTCSARSALPPEHKPAAAARSRSPPGESGNWPPSEPSPPVVCRGFPFSALHRPLNAPSRTASSTRSALRCESSSEAAL